MTGALNVFGIGKRRTGSQMEVADGAIIDIEFGTDPELVLAPIRATLPEGGMIVELEPAPGNVQAALRPRRFIVGRTAEVTRKMWFAKVTEAWVAEKLGKTIEVDWRKVEEHGDHA
jgi:hypothetical protein